MAFKKNVKLNNGLICESAYVRIEQIAASYFGETTITVRMYKDKNLPSFHESIHKAPNLLRSSNPIYDAYNFIKSLPAYSDAEDC